ncbi:MAG: hypothetical protein ACP5TV_06680 [Anaerolineae bacterium]
MPWVRFDPDGMPAPSLDLPAAGGGEMGIMDFRGRSSLLVLFCHGPACPGCQEAVTCLAEREKDLEFARAEAVIVLPAAPPSGDAVPAGRRLHGVIDAERALHREYAGLLPGASPDEAMLFVLDQYGVPWAGWHGAEPAGGLCAEGIEWLEFIALQCPE